MNSTFVEVIVPQHRADVVRHDDELRGLGKLSQVSFFFTGSRSEVQKLGYEYQTMGNDNKSRDAEKKRGEGNEKGLITS